MGGRPNWDLIFDIDMSLTIKIKDTCSSSLSITTSSVLSPLFCKLNAFVFSQICFGVERWTKLTVCLKCLSYHSASDVGDIYLDQYISSSFFRSVKPHSFEVIYMKVPV